MNFRSQNIVTWRSCVIPSWKGGNRLALWLVALALLPLSLLVYGVQVTRAASAENADVNHSGSLCFRSLLAYGITNQPQPNAAWRPVLAKMASIRADLRFRHPQAVAQTDRAWSAFSGSLTRTGRVDWQTALQMRDAADRLTQSLEDMAKRKYAQANALFLVGIAATLTFSGLALAGARSGQRAEQMQAQTQERFRVLFEQSSDAHLLFDESGILDCNHAAVQMLRCRDKAEVLALHPAVLSPEFQADGRRSLEKCVEMDSIAREQGYHRFEWLHQKTDGTVFPVEVTLTPVLLGGKAALLVVWHDLTERKAAEEQLKLLSTVAAASVNGVVITDPQERILFINPAFERLTGYTLDEVRGRRPNQILHGPDTAAETRQRLRQAINAHQPITAELLNYHKNGTAYWIEMHITPVMDGRGEITHFIAVETDITQRKQIEHALCKSQEQLMLAQQIAKMGSWENDLVTGKVTWSAEMFRLLGLAPEQGVPDFAAHLALYHPDDVALLNACIQRAIEEGLDYELDLRPIAASEHSLRWFHAVGKVVRNETGQTVQLVGTLADITERKTIEEAIRKSQENLNHAQAMAHVGSWERDYRKGTMTWSDELFRLCGLEPGSITPSIEALFLHIHPLDQQMAQEQMTQAIQEGRGANFEMRLVGADNVFRHIHLCTEIFIDEAGLSIGSRGSLTDITERIKALQEQTKFVSLIENSRDFIAMATLDGMFLTLNPAGRQLVGLERMEDVTTSLLPDFMPAETWNRVRQEVLPIVRRDDGWEGECRLVNVVKGKIYDMQASFFLIRDPVSGEPMCLATVQRDITEQKWMDAQLQHNLVLVQEQNVELEWQRQGLEAANTHLEALATTDGLTGARNHRAFQERLLEEFTRAGRAHRPFSVILLDVDKFKSYNDTYGHPEGDRVLKQVVRVLQETVRETDFVARYGGEEFIVLLPETGVEGAMQAAERFRETLEKQDWPLRPITASFGVSSLHIDIKTPQQLIDMADKALYASKAGGRNRVTHAATLPISSAAGG